MWGLPHALLFGVRSSQFVSILNCSNSNLCICPTSAPSIEYNFICVGNIIVIILTGIFFIFILAHKRNSTCYFLHKLLSHKCTLLESRVESLHSTLFAKTWT
uniref:Uncharacterized protein n=1 Tax=Cacopsylla melanoneura TaxID=428564 RepID=A0A8D8TFX3_9HEMI